MSLELYAAYVAASIVVIIVPGPTVTLIIAPSIRHGVRAGLVRLLSRISGGFHIGDGLSLAYTPAK